MTSSVKMRGGSAAKFSSRSEVSCQEASSPPKRYRNTTPASLAYVSAENRTCSGRRFQGTAASPFKSSGVPPSVTEVNTTCGGMLGGGTGCGSNRERPRLVPIQTAPSSAARNAFVSSQIKPSDRPKWRQRARSNTSAPLSVPTHSHPRRSNPRKWTCQVQRVVAGREVLDLSPPAGELK